MKAQRRVRLRRAAMLLQERSSESVVAGNRDVEPHEVRAHHCSRRSQHGDSQARLSSEARRPGSRGAALSRGGLDTGKALPIRGHSPLPCTASLHCFSVAFTGLSGQLFHLSGRFVIPVAIPVKMDLAHCRCRSRHLSRRAPHTVGSSYIACRNAFRTLSRTFGVPVAGKCAACRSAFRTLSRTSLPPVVLGMKPCRTKA